ARIKTFQDSLHCGRTAPSKRTQDYYNDVHQQGLPLSTTYMRRRPDSLQHHRNDCRETHGMNMGAVTNTLTITRTVTNTRTSTNFCVSKWSSKKELTSFGATTPRKPQANRRTLRRVSALLRRRHVFHLTIKLLIVVPAVIVATSSDPYVMVFAMKHRKERNRQYNRERRSDSARDDSFYNSAAWSAGASGRS